MARGYPDYFGQSMYLRMGKVELYHGVGIVCAFGAVTHILDVDNRMMIKACRIILQDIAEPDSVNIEVTIDADVAADDSIDTFYTNNVTKPDQGLIYCVVYAPALERYVLQFSMDLTIDTNILINVNNVSAADCTAEIMYLYGHILR